jgi:hypothetical protein
MEYTPEKIAESCFDGTGEKTGKVSLEGLLS